MDVSHPLFSLRLRARLQMALSSSIGGRFVQRHRLAVLRRRVGLRPGGLAVSDRGGLEFARLQNRRSGEELRAVVVARAHPLAEGSRDRTNEHCRMSHAA